MQIEQSEQSEQIEQIEQIERRLRFKYIYSSENA